MEFGRSKCRRYSAEFKSNTVELCLSSGKSVSKIAQELGLSKQTLHGWVNMSKTKDKELSRKDKHPEDIKSLQKEIIELRKKLVSVEEEALILKKCIAFFAKK